ncbi:hypothetical protein Lalb_Chr08g0241241 [Lupinus albus]|uniref:Uncharacterized protein n=1 Tax=Lupinus albus TaxID=3870 RepID=A0A6A4Q694_LUPAL|nr:hypothetical protein Lalb_Chr08g0241241 [Lupinus albus]
MERSNKARKNNRQMHSPVEKEVGGRTGIDQTESLEQTGMSGSGFEPEKISKNRVEEASASETVVLSEPVGCCGGGELWGLQVLFPT